MKKNALLRLLVFVLAMMLCVPALGMAEEDDPRLAEGADIRMMSFHLMHPDWSKVKITGRPQKAADIDLQ